MNQHCAIEGRFLHRRPDRRRKPWVFEGSVGIPAEDCLNDGAGMSACESSRLRSIAGKTPILAIVALGIFVSNTSIARAVEQAEATTGIVAVPADDFLNSLGICIHHAQGVDAQSYVAPLKYLGVRNIRDDFGKPQGYVYLNKQTGVKANLIASSKDLGVTIEGLKYVARDDALLSIEGPNEPNNFPIIYQGKTGGGFQRLFGKPADWTAVASFQRDLYHAVKTDALLAKYPVFNVSEVGAQSPNLGLQFLEIPPGAETVFPAGTRFADYLNVHNYVIGTQKRYVDNQAWNAADPLLNAGWDGLFGNHGRLWGHGYRGYGNAELPHVPKVTTETGWDSNSDFGGEKVQGTVLLNTYLAQYKRGWKYTFLYMLRDGEGGAGNQGVYNADSSPKRAAHYIHNFTSILSDKEEIKTPRAVRYRIENASPTTHDLLLQAKPNEFFLVVWGERTSGGEDVQIRMPSKMKSVRIYDPTLGAEPIETAAETDHLTLWVTDHPIIIRFVADAS
ncbi:glycosyl hydrolase [Methylobacterium sp. M6A4_1b]